MIDRSKAAAPPSSDRRRENRRQSDRRVADRRRDVRYPANARLRFLSFGAIDDRVLPGTLSDVSASGVRIVIDEPLKAPQNLLIEIHDGARLQLNLVASLVWCKPIGEGRHEAGCELSVELSRSQLADLKTTARMPS